MKAVSIGEVLWDLFPDGERLGGAPFNFSAHAARLGAEVVLLSAVGDDARGREARARARSLGLPVEWIQVVEGVPTGAVTVFLDPAGQPDFTIHRPAAYDRLRLSEEALGRLATASPEWVYYGTLHQADADARAETVRLLAALPGARRFWDVNLRRGCWTPPLLDALMREAHVVKMNQDEAAEIDRLHGARHDSLRDFTADWSQRLGWHAVAVTRGGQGCVVRIGGDYAESPGYPVAVVDTVGSGDAFAAAFLHALAQGFTAMRAGAFANRLGAVVASRAGAIPPWTMADCEDLR